MKAVIAVAALSLAPCVMRVSKPEAAAMVQTRDPVRAARAAIRQPKPGMDYDEVIRLLPVEVTSKPWMMVAGFNSSESYYKLDADHYLCLSSRFANGKFVYVGAGIYRHGGGCIAKSGDP